jgi:ADP-dependent NAD(P)H-hydrate dehydratase / NAD(P)H-hydrate epimerase
MFAVVGTVPEDEFPLIDGPVSVKGGRIDASGHEIDINRGTAALLAAAIMVSQYLGGEAPHAFLTGDTGRGHGSRKLYEYLEKTLPRRKYASLTFHYVQPDVDWHNRVLFAVEKMPSRPLMIADAGFMYAAKMSGQAGAYDIFTPDAGELAFLADESAPHPFYTRGFILHENQRAPELIKRAYKHDNAPRYLLVKGEKDMIADQGGILDCIDHPSSEAMEAIGGTGDIITGLVAGFTGNGYDLLSSCLAAIRISRMAGQAANPDPGTQVADIIGEIPGCLKKFYGPKRS